MGKIKSRKAGTNARGGTNTQTHTQLRWDGRDQDEAYRRSEDVNPPSDSSSLWELTLEDGIPRFSWQDMTVCVTLTTVHQQTGKQSSLSEKQQPGFRSTPSQLQDLRKTATIFRSDTKASFTQRLRLIGIKGVGATVPALRELVYARCQTFPGYCDCIHTHSMWHNTRHEATTHITSMMRVKHFPASIPAMLIGFQSGAKIVQDSSSGLHSHTPLSPNLQAGLQRGSSVWMRLKCWYTRTHTFTFFAGGQIMKSGLQSTLPICPHGDKDRDKIQNSRFETETRPRLLWRRPFVSADTTRFTSPTRESNNT